MKTKALALLALLPPACAEAVEVELAVVRRAPIEESFREPARTRLARTYPITMPIAGRLGRIELEPGDPVRRGQELVAFDLLPLDQDVAEAEAAVAELEASIQLNEYDDIERTLKREAEDAIAAARDVVASSRAEVEAQRARAQRAEVELERMQGLAAQDRIAKSELDDAALLAETSLIDLRAEEFTFEALETFFTIVQLGPTYVEQWLGRKDLVGAELVQRLAQARAGLVRARHARSLAVVTSPIDGVVLERHEQGSAALPAGTPLLLLGQPADLEVVADVLTEDAQRLAPGARVELQAPAFDAPLESRVVRVEPQAFTKLSSLGVEQQRVRVIASLNERPDSLGVGFRLHARFLTARREDALVVPRASVLQSRGGEHHVLVVEGGRVRRRVVELGLRAALELEVFSGLAEGDEVVAAPDATIPDGARVRVRS